ncbi:hypothetical protein MCUN1_000671 [Malassezia cuniculi]|uniref:Thioredoxin-like fold domain-containing protein n=1 Tax=Malassezia cuniculi TaxID=948313 RepID=A0AAF0EWA7_9BASI|nr:hypothetical protein MCUN1_000671 [Malassezia cuniculi]
MALPPQLASLSIGPVNAPHVLELYLDYLCPFSAKILLNFVENALPLINGAQAQFRNAVRVILRPVPQPWHAASTLLHETALAAAHLSLEDPAETASIERNAFWQASLELMRNHQKWYEPATANSTFDSVRDDIAKTVAPALDPSIVRSTSIEADLRSKTRISPEGNTGTSVVPDLKYCIKIGRQNGVHVTPTALWNGIIEPSVSSSFSRDDWQSFFEARVPRAKA